jgi:hypothetical protein
LDIPTAYIITFCRSEKDVPTNLLTINTIRIGYPNYRVMVVDNASPPPLQNYLRNYARDFEFVAMPHSSHEATIRAILNRHANTTSPLVILDADVLFWDSCEEWAVDGLYAGRFVPKFKDDFSGTITHPRLHTSHLVIPRPDKLAFSIQRKESEVINLDLISPTTVYRDEQWERFDTTGLLYGVFQEQAHEFTENELNCFDHIFCGSSLDIVAPRLGDDGRELMRLHEVAVENPQEVRGIWRWQQQFFDSRSL